MTNIPKFRAWLIKEEKMCEVLQITFYEPQVFVSRGFRDDEFYSHDEVILMQSTGLHDKNGVEIFCDDIVQFTFDFESCGEMNHHDGYHLVSIDERGIGLHFKKLAWVDEGKNQIWNVERRGLIFQDNILGYWANDMKSCVHCHVVGSVHQNKELLNDN